MKTNLLVMVMAMAVALTGCSKSNSEPTALNLAKLGNAYVGEHAKDKVVQIRSDKSVGSLTPNVWYVVYYDQTAPLKAVEVKFGAGQMMGVERPLRLLEPLFGNDQPLLADKIKIDSNEAIELALKEPILKNLKVTSTAPKLERGEDGLPVWKVRVWAAKLRNPTEEADLGEIILSAEDGKLRLAKVEISRVD
ncbi:MAG: hypothetical protein AB1705_01395 [Verrucomicrobiota bacterium]